MADPAWLYGDHCPGNGRGAAKHYRCLPLDVLCGLRLPPIADDAWLFLWRTGQHQREALDVCEHWGFREYGELVWVKTSARGWPRISMGRLARYVHESLLVGRKGRPRRRPTATAIASVFFAPQPRGEHSEKPDELYSLVQELVPGPYGELFAVRERPGWQTWGDAIGRPLRAERENER